MAWDRENWSSLSLLPVQPKEEDDHPQICTAKRTVSIKARCSPTSNQPSHNRPSSAFFSEDAWLHPAVLEKRLWWVAVHLLERWNGEVGAFLFRCFGAWCSSESSSVRPILLPFSATAYFPGTIFNFTQTVYIDECWLEVISCRSSFEPHGCQHVPWILSHILIAMQERCMGMLPDSIRPGWPSQRSSECWLLSIP